MDSAMQPLVLPYEKDTILNAIYDVADAWGLTIRHVNSERGVILLDTFEGGQVRVTVDTVFPSGATKVGTVGGEDVPEWSAAFFDELRTMLDGSFRRDEIDKALGECAKK